MKNYLIKRILTLIPMLFVMSVIIFTLIHLIPGDPAQVILGENAKAEDVAGLRVSMGLEDPLPMQYARWVGNVLRGDLGQSVFIKGSMIQIIGSHMVPTLTLTAYAIVLAVIVAIPLGVFAAKNRSGAFDYFVESFSMAGISVPSFLVALLFVLLLAVKFGLLPVAGYKPVSEYGLLANMRYMALPVAALAIQEIALLIRMTRSSVLEILGSDFIRMIKAKGIGSFSTIWKHALRNALLPILTTIGQNIMALLAGAVVIETIFNIPGIGQLIINSVSRRDYEVIQAIVLVVALINVLVCLVVDISYGIIDPRVRLGGAKGR
jgi:peptide/nickel transport system permease protein